MKGTFLGAFVFAACAASASAQGALIVVDAANGPGADATSIVDAIGLANDGDTLLVRTGTYAPFTIESRTLVVMAEPGATVIVEAAAPNYLGSTIVLGVSPSQVVVLEGLTLHGGYDPIDGTELDALLIEDCAGQVWIQDCTLRPILGFSTDYAGLRAVDSSNVIVVRSTTDPLSSGGFGPTAAGLLAEGSRVFAYESTFTAASGGIGAKLDDSFLFAEQTAIQGGQAFAFLDLFGQCFPQWAGGVGLWLNGTSRAEMLESTWKGGPKSLWCSSAGPDFQGNGAALHVIAGPALSFTAESPTLDGQPSALTLSGPPGDLGLVLMATSLPPVKWVAKFKGGIATGAPFLVLLGPLPASGELVVPVNFGDVLSPDTASTVFLQGGVLHAGGGGQLADPASWSMYEE